SGRSSKRLRQRPSERSPSAEARPGRFHGPFLEHPWTAAARREIVSFPLLTRPLRGAHRSALATRCCVDGGHRDDIWWPRELEEEHNGHVAGSGACPRASGSSPSIAPHGRRDDPNSDNSLGAQKWLSPSYRRSPSGTTTSRRAMGSASSAPSP